MRTAITPLATYRNERPYPFCPGCGHGPILDALNAALVRLELDPAKVVVVSDIGCAGLSDQYFVTSAFHGLHGRCLTYAAGIRLARPELTVVAILGDGGAGIGGAHLLAAARRNVDLTVLLCNNFNFGMTGGQHSPTTPPGAVTATTPKGSLERPLDVCATVAVNGAAYAWRGTSFDRDLPERIAEAISTPGFALLDVWELCAAYFVPANRASRKTLAATREELGFAGGVVARREVEEYGAAYRRVWAGAESRAAGPSPLEPRFASQLAGRFRLVAAGSAGGRVRSAVSLLASAAILSDLWAAQRDDYPVTVQTGHSVAELVLDRGEVCYAGIERPDAVLILSDDGLRKVGRHLAAVGPDGRVIAVPDLGPIRTRAPLGRLDLSEVPYALARGHLAFVAVAAAAREWGLVPAEALRAAAAAGPSRYRARNLEAVEAGLRAKIAG